MAWGHCPPSFVGLEPPLNEADTIVNTTRDELDESMHVYGDGVVIKRASNSVLSFVVCHL